VSEYAETDIAVVGMAAHLPGARSVDEYWKNLVEGVESVRFFTDEELLDAGVPRSLIRHPRYVKAHACVPDMELFDGEFFGFSPKESAILDPQHRHFLECSWEALEDANIVPDHVEGPIGVFGGCGMGSYFYFNLCTNPDLVDSVGMFLLRHTGNDKDFLTTRVSHVLDLTGPSVNVQTACSTSLVAIHYAAQALMNQECDVALAGGVTILQPQYVGYMYEEGEVLSPDGHCHAFDHRGQGTVFGSGAGVVVLKRLEEALEDGDHVYAVLNSTAINNDGASKAGYLAPSVTGQAGCIVEAQALADLGGDDIGYVECHGTGTYLGDPIEVSALTEAFRQTTEEKQFCRLGSVKTNIGHLDTAAGVASFIKASLILEREQIPASLNFEAPNPAIDFESSPFLVNDALTPWPRSNTPRRAGVQSLGVGGTNAHVILQEPPLPKASGAATRAEQVLVVSGRTNGAAAGNAEKLAAHLRAHPEQKLADVAHTLRTGRKHFERRRVVVAHDHESAAKYLSGQDPRRVFSHVALEDPKTVFLFPGGSAQYATMARDLLQAHPVFREVIDRATKALKDHGAEYDLREALEAEGPEAEEALLDMRLQLPAIFSVSYGVAKLLESWGVTPDAMIGHSNGEYVAATLAEVFTFEEALGLVLCRGRLMDEVEEGAMLAVPLSADEVRPMLGSGVEVAGANAPGLTVVSGNVAAIERLEKQLSDKDLEPRRLDIHVAAHSHMFEPILESFREYLEKMSFRGPKARICSSRTGTWLTPEQATDPGYWVDHFRHTVEFSRAIETVAAEGDAIFVEVGPGKALSSFAKSHASVPNTAVLSTLRHKDEAIPDDRFFLEVLARLWACGAEVDLGRLQEGEERRRVRLPTYAFQRQHYFIEPGKGAAQGQAEVERAEELAGFGWEPYWKPAAVEPGTGEKESWLVFMDDAGVGQRAVKTLRGQGHQVTLVYPGDTFGKKTEGEYILSPERGREGYDLLVRELVQKARVPNRILHLWLTTADEGFRPGSSFFHRNLERGFWSLFFLAQALADENVPKPLDATVVTNGAHALGDERVRYPEKATVLGPAQVVPREMPGFTVRALDVVLPEASSRLFGGKLAMAFVDPFAGRKAVTRTLDDIADAVVEEASGERESAVAILREGKRYVRAYRQRRLEDVETSLVRDGGTYLITGGLGGLGLVAAEELAKAATVDLVLLSRSGLPPRDEWDAWIEEHGDADTKSRRMLRVRELEALGATVRVAAGDVTNLEQMREITGAAAEKLGPIRGVIHTAGVVADDLLQIKSLAEVEDVLAPKLHGTMVLDEIFGCDAGCDFLVLYSSTSTAIAPPGQVDYVAANAFLNAYARSSDAGPKRIAINWGIWNQVGMAAEAFDVTDLSASADELPATTKPLFDGRVRDVHGQLHLVGEHGPGTHWIYDEHRVKGPNPDDARGWSLIPGTGYLEVAAEALHELGEHGTFEIRDLFFIRPLQIDDGASREVRVKMRRNDEGYAMEIRSACQVEGRPAWQLHAQATLALGHSLDGVSRKTHDVDAIAKRCERVESDETGIRSPQEEHLSFGPRWRVLTEARYGDGEALGSLRLPSEAAGDLDAGWMLHPAMMDLATGFAMDLIEGYQPTNVWVPVSYERVRVFGALPKRIRSWVRSAGENTSESDFALFDIDLMDESGQVLVEIRRFAIRKMEGKVSFAVASPPTRADVEMDPSAERGEERQLSPAEQRLRRNLERGIVPAEGGEALARVLASPQSEIIVSSLNLKGLIEEAGELVVESPGGGGAKFARPELDSDYVEPRDDVERTLVGFWEELLGVETVGVKDSFFDLGGHSLIAVRLFAMVKKAYQVEFPISVLFEAPTIEACAGLIKDAIGDVPEEGEAPTSSEPKRRYTHLVAMHPSSGGGDERPFFLVAGMFGNVLNLRHLAHLIGTDRPFYGLQARGLYGSDEPHATFEEMARDYIAEMRTVQEHGPYMVGGFSGGGYTALEIARQLKEAGEEIALLVMLDTPGSLIPETLSMKDRATIQVQRFEQKGAKYLVEWAQSRVEWELGKIRKRFEEPEELSSAEFHNEAIEMAFRGALARYEIPHWDGELILFRPPLEKAYVLGPERILNHDREYVYDDNGWSEKADVVKVFEVPGDHDSMVLEPNVRVLARKLRELIDEVEVQDVPAAPASRMEASAEE